MERSLPPAIFHPHYAGSSHENHDDRAAFRDGGTQLSVAEELVKTSDCQGAMKLVDGSIQIKSFVGPNGKMTDMRIGPRKTDAGGADLYGEFDRICFSGKSDQLAAPSEAYVAAPLNKRGRQLRRPCKG
jgi:hypothetical protein